MRDVTVLARPTDGALHPLDRAMREESDVKREDIHRAELLDDDTVVTFAEAKGDAGRLRDIPANSDLVRDFTVTADDEGRIYSYSHYEPNETIRDLLLRRREQEPVVRMPLEYTDEGHMRATYVGVLGVLFQGVLVGRLSRQYHDSSLAVAGSALLVAALATLPFAPELGRALVPQVGGPAFLTRELLALALVLPALSLGNALTSVSLTTLVSKAAGAEVQGSAFGITQGAGSLGRTVGPPIMAALYVVAFWTPFVVGAGLLVGTLLVLVRRSRSAVGAVGAD